MSFMSVFDNNNQPEEEVKSSPLVSKVVYERIANEDKIKFVDKLGDTYLKDAQYVYLRVKDIIDIFDKEIGNKLPPITSGGTPARWERMKLFFKDYGFQYFGTEKFVFVIQNYSIPYKISRIKKIEKESPEIINTKSVDNWELNKVNIVQDIGIRYLNNTEVVHLSISDLIDIFMGYSNVSDRKNPAEIRIELAKFVNNKNLDGIISKDFMFSNAKDIYTNRPYIVSKNTIKSEPMIDIESCITKILPLLIKNHPYKVREIVELLEQKDKQSLDILTNNKFFKEQELEKLFLQYDRKTISNIKIIQELVPNNSHGKISYWSFIEEEVIIQPQIEIVPYIEPSYMEIEEAKKRILNTLISRVLDEKSEMCNEEILLLMDEDKDLSMLLEYYKFKEDEDYETIEDIIVGILIINSDKNIGDWKIIRTIKILDKNNRIPLWSKKEVERYIEEDPEVVMARVIKRLWSDTGYSTLALLSIVKKTEFTFYENVLNKNPWIDHERLLAILNHVSKKNLNGKVIWQKRSCLEGWYIEDYVEESVVINKKTEIEERLERIESKLDTILKYTLEKITRPVPVNIDIPIHEITEEDIFDTIEIGKSFTVKDLMYIHKTDDHVIRSRLKKLVKKGLIKYDKEKFSFTNQDNQTQATWRDRYSRATQEEVND